ncbi:MAG: LCP family protein [Raoultibacter sp.]
MRQQSAQTTRAAQAPEPSFADSRQDWEQEIIIRKKRRRKKRLKHPVLLGVVCAIVLAVGVTAAALAITISTGGKNLQAYENVQVEAPQEALKKDGGQTVAYGGHTYQLNKNMVSIMFVGFDRTTFAEAGEKAGQADAIVVMAFDTATGKVTALSIPRDAMVPVDTYTPEGAFVSQQTMQVCLAYHYGDGAQTSCEHTAAAVSRMLYSMPLNYYFALDETGVGPMADAIDGVPLTALQSIPGTQIVAGEDVLLFGDSAFKYVQYRDTSVLNSSLDRQARQVQFIQSFAKKSLGLAQGSVNKLLDLYAVAADYSVTNLGISEFSFLASSVISNGVTGVSMETLPGTLAQGEKYAEYTLDKTGVYQTVLNTYYTQID